MEERRYENGREPAILDVVEISMLKSLPKGHQTENHVIDAKSYWQKKADFDREHANSLLDQPESVWGTGHSTFHGSHDRVPTEDAEQWTNSLLLIQPDRVRIRVLVPSANFGNPKRAVRVSFSYHSDRYDLTVTDPIAEGHYLAKPDGDYELTGETYFCVSLAEAHTDGFCYKLVATVINKELLGQLT